MRGGVLKNSSIVEQKKTFVTIKRSKAIKVDSRGEDLCPNLPRTKNEPCQGAMRAGKNSCDLERGGSVVKKRGFQKPDD